MNDGRSARLAVLIDADNASAKIADGLFEEIAKIGEASVRRIYGDFSTQRMKGWTDILARHAIIPQQQFAYTTGKNASDITLVIDAMDLVHSGRFDGFCLVSSDSDFTRLASRIREEGLDVYGFGEQKTPESFRQACRRFIYTENLLPERIAPGRGAETVAAPLAPPSAVTPMLKRVIDQMESEDGWVNLGTFGKQLQTLYTDFDPRTYGHKKLSDLVRKSGVFDIDHPEGGSIRIRLKQTGERKGAEPVAARPAAAVATATAKAPVPAPMPAPVASEPKPSAAAPVVSETPSPVALLSPAELAASVAAATAPAAKAPARRSRKPAEAKASGPKAGAPAKAPVEGKAPAEGKAAPQKAPAEAKPASGQTAGAPAAAPAKRPVAAAPTSGGTASPATAPVPAAIAKPADPAAPKPAPRKRRPLGNA